MNVVVDAIKLANILAHQSLLDEVNSAVSGFIGYVGEEDLYNPEGDYKPEFQEIYERWYDYYFEVITNIAND